MIPKDAWVVLASAMGLVAVFAWLLVRSGARKAPTQPRRAPGTDPLPAQPPLPPQSPKQGVEVKANVSTGEVEVVFRVSDSNVEFLARWSPEVVRHLAQLLLNAAEGIDGKIHPYDDEARGKNLLIVSLKMASYLHQRGIDGDIQAADLAAEYNKVKGY